MKLQLLRNATLVLSLNGKTILIDPMLAPKGSYDPFVNSGNEQRNPTVDLPMNKNELVHLISNIDAILLTHIHLDHWDTAAKDLLPKDISLFCQPANAEAISEAGFTNVTPINDTLVWNDIRIDRTNGQHGTGDIEKRMGVVSGYVITYADNSIYIAGDTIWCKDVQSTLDKYQPGFVVVNGGANRFVTGEPIVMDINDIKTVCNYAPNSKIYVMHLEATNHATESRADIKAALQENKLTEKVFVPFDGEYLI